MVQLQDLPAELRQEIILQALPSSEITVFDLCPPIPESLFLTCKQLHDDTRAALPRWRPACVVRLYAHELAVFAKAQEQKLCPRLECLRLQVFSGLQPGVGQRPKDEKNWYDLRVVYPDIIGCLRLAPHLRRDGTDRVVVDVTYATQELIDRRPQWVPWHVNRLSKQHQFDRRTRLVVKLLRDLNHRYNGDAAKGAASGGGTPVVSVCMGGLVDDFYRGTVASMLAKCQTGPRGFETTFVGSYTQPDEEIPLILSLPGLLERWGIGREGESPPPLQAEGEDGLDFSALHPLSPDERDRVFYTEDAFRDDISARDELIRLLNVALERRIDPSVKYMQMGSEIPYSRMHWLRGLCDKLELESETISIPPQGRFTHYQY